VAQGATIIDLNARRFRLPGPRDRMAIIGRTGSGKTHFASWVLSYANWPTRPWVIIDYKKDDILRELPTEEIGVNDRRLPRHPGLYVVHPRGRHDDEAVEAMLGKIWAKGATGVYVDEGHMLPDSGGLQDLLTQGRSKSIPVICLTQRPKWLNRFVFSESDYYALFHLNDKRDRITVGEFLPEQAKEPLPARYSWYYDVSHNALFKLRPVPGRQAILDTFDERNPARVKKRMI
jgi:DNA helicase HerA-like ATPase